MLNVNRLLVYKYYLKDKCLENGYRLQTRIIE